MKTGIPQPRANRESAFTLLEMIGVIAVMAILAAAVAPNALRTLDRSAVRTEAATLRSVGEQVKIFLKTNGWPPGLNPNLGARLSWDQDLRTFTDISPADLLTNKRQINRSYIYEPGASPRRVLILSSMRVGLPLPTAANLNTTALFDNVWNTADGSVPPAGQSWAGWAAWRAILNGTAGEYLVIERVNLAPIYNTELQNLTFVLNNRGTAQVSYSFILADGTTQGPFNLAAPIAPATNNGINVTCRPRDRINLFRPGPILDYSYVVPTGSSGRTFDFNNATNWVPQP
ncbi:MAG: type II secretion system protein [Nibricoccus sp.]